MDEKVEAQKNHFNSISARYLLAREHPNHTLLKELIWGGFLNKNKKHLTAVTSVLEPMCGLAEGEGIIRKFCSHVFRYQGFDYSDAMVEQANQIKPDLNIKVGDVTRFDCGKEKYDLIIIIGGLHHVYDKTKSVIDHLSKAQIKGGYFISFEPTHNNWIARLMRERIYKSNDLFDDNSEQGYEYKELNRAFQDADYVKIDEVYPGLLSYVLYYNPDAFPFLNIGSTYLVRILFFIDRLFWRNVIGRKLSFATLTLWQKS